jgi:hypothetical protein
MGQLLLEFPARVAHNKGALHLLILKNNFYCKEVAHTFKQIRQLYRDDEKSCFLLVPKIQFDIIPVEQKRIMH